MTAPVIFRSKSSVPTLLFRRTQTFVTHLNRVTCENVAANTRRMTLSGARAATFLRANKIWKLNRLLVTCESLQKKVAINLRGYTARGELT